MGLLKHFVFPALILLHANVVLQGILNVKSGGRLALIKQFEWEGSAEREALGTWEEHALGIVCGGHAAFLAAVVWSTFADSAHVRGVVAVMELIWWFYGAYDAQRLGMPCEVAYILSAVLAVALIIHAKEPGIFTKDKSADTSKKAK